MLIVRQEISGETSIPYLVILTWMKKAGPSSRVCLKKSKQVARDSVQGMARRQKRNWYLRIGDWLRSMRRAGCPPNLFSQVEYNE